MDTYQNPLISRYSTSEMAELFSDTYKVGLWRRLWVALAESQKELGLAITSEQIEEMKRFEKDINFDIAKQKEKECRHDVMSHIHAFAMQAKKAAPIIHLGATSCFVTDNADIMIFDNALKMIRAKILGVVKLLSAFAIENAGVATLGYTHLQAAQVTTIGKRTSLWLFDLVEDLESIEHFLKGSKLRGVKGTTGTQASYLALFGGNHKKVVALDKLLAKKMGYEQTMLVTGQTYSRKLDYALLSLLSGVAQSCYKFASDLRLLQGFRELEEPFEKSQIGSSAMAYKRNPMRSERLCSLARFVIGLPTTAANTEVAQWLERTLDDSAIRRITIPQAFLALDGVLNLHLNIASGLVVNHNIVAKRLAAEMPFMATETLLMECVQAGGDRQQCHELIRQKSMEAVAIIKAGGENPLIDLLKKEKALGIVKDKWDKILDPQQYKGRAQEQTIDFVQTIVEPLLQKHKAHIVTQSEVSV